MKKFSAPTLEEAITLAKREFDCLVSELEYEIILYPKKGFLGFFAQDAVIVARKIDTSLKTKDEKVPEEKQEDQGFYSQIEQNFFEDKPQAQDMAQNISKELKALFRNLPYKITDIKVKIEKEVVYIEFFGEDCGLLIGERGYRYSAIYHLLSIWIKKEYGMSLKLEIADFLKNKEQRIIQYLEENYDQILSRTSFQTRSFDTLTASIALKRFREAIPNKYIVIKPISENESVILINEFRGK